MTFAAIQTYIIESYPLFAASAIGATAVLRSLTGFGFPLFARLCITNLVIAGVIVCSGSLFWLLAMPGLLSSGFSVIA